MSLTRQNHERHWAFAARQKLNDLLKTSTTWQTTPELAKAIDVPQTTVRCCLPRFNGRLLARPRNGKMTEYAMRGSPAVDGAPSSDASSDGNEALMYAHAPVAASDASDPKHIEVETPAMPALPKALLTRAHRNVLIQVCEHHAFGTGIDMTPEVRKSLATIALVLESHGATA